MWAHLTFVLEHELVQVVSVDQYKPISPDYREQVFGHQILE